MTECYGLSADYSEKSSGCHFLFAFAKKGVAWEKGEEYEQTYRLLVRPECDLDDHLDPRPNWESIQYPVYAFFRALFFICLALLIVCVLVCLADVVIKKAAAIKELKQSKKKD